MVYLPLCLNVYEYILDGCLRVLQDKTGASSVFQLDAFFIRAATGPPRLGEGEPLIRRGKVPLSTTSASPITLSNTPTSPRVSGYVREQSSHPNGWGPA